jgi:hypothetical protein
MSSNPNQAAGLLVTQHGVVGCPIAQVTSAVDIRIFVDRKAIRIDPYFHELSRADTVTEPRTGNFEPFSIQSVALHSVDQLVSVGEFLGFK